MAQRKSEGWSILVSKERPGQQRHTVSPMFHRFIPVVIMLGLLATAAWAETLSLPPSLVDADTDAGEHTSRSRPTFSLKSTSRTAASRVS